MDFIGIRNVNVYNVVVIFYCDLATLDKSKKTGKRKRKCRSYNVNVALFPLL